MIKKKIYLIWIPGSMPGDDSKKGTGDDGNKKTAGMTSTTGARHTRRVPAVQIICGEK